jgi:hypothetical protein
MVTLPRVSTTVALPADPLADGRQSARALAIRRGTMRLLAQRGLCALPEVTLGSGRRADLLAIDAAGAISIIEIKSSLADLAADRKWPAYRDHCDALFFATAPDVPADAFPGDAGLIIADAFGGAIVRDAPAHGSLAPARRKTLLILAARLGAARLGMLADPDGPIAAVTDRG